MNGLLQLDPLTKLLSCLIFAKSVPHSTLLIVTSKDPPFECNVLMIHIIFKLCYALSIIELKLFHDFIREEVFQVGWNPKNETILASCCLGRRLMVWDLSRYFLNNNPPFFYLLDCYCIYLGLLLSCLYNMTNTILNFKFKPM